MFSAAWSPDGKRIATVSKDGLIRVYEPRKSNSPIAVSIPEPANYVKFYESDHTDYSFKRSENLSFVL